MALSASMRALASSLGMKLARACSGLVGSVGAKRNLMMISRFVAASLTRGVLSLECSSRYQFLVLRLKEAGRVRYC